MMKKTFKNYRDYFKYLDTIKDRKDINIISVEIFNDKIILKYKVKDDK